MQARTTTSVALATYNGSSYLKVQLESIADQTCQADEIIIGDDCSTDDTEQVVHDFAQAHKNLRIMFHRNEKRLGSTMNFEAIARRCRGSILVFSDQDDIWLPTRIDRLVRALNDDASAMFAFSDGHLVDEDGLIIPGSLFSGIGFTLAKRQTYAAGRGVDVLLRHNVVTGAALAVRREALMSILPFEAGWIHDYFIALFLQIIGHGVVIDEALIQYRLHRAQQLGVARSTLSQAMAYARKQNEFQCAIESANFIRLRQRLLLRGVPADHEIIDVLGQKAAFMLLRSKMRQHPIRSPLLLLQALRDGDYRRLSLGWKQFIVDLLSIGLAAKKAMFSGP